MANRLANEKSPYLLQHARNPVDWHPWSDEAFTTAAREDKPIFLSIGYSTCHWCHVMERESFEDEEIAKLLNQTFVCIKVDREERPDIDNIYMTVCSMMTGSGGWPLTVIMTPDKKPFFAGTYFAKHTQYGRIGMLDMIPRLHDIWHNRRDEVLESTDRILEILQQQNDFTPGRELDREILHRAFNELSNRYDSIHGGFSKAPKFPTPHNITFLLRYWKMTGNDHALAMVEHTLTAMRQGGIFDQIGFGFHRYATDEKWLLPHFEKMLYDQALLAIAYLEAYQVTGNSFFKQTAEEIFTYVLRDMTAPAGGFFSAEDADS
ncbi:thioredoxin domain-containing protein, partial [Thermodesulfobacteriota bacterium]